MELEYFISTGRESYILEIYYRASVQDKQEQDSKEDEDLHETTDDGFKLPQPAYQQ